MSPVTPDEERILICDQRHSIGFDKDNLDADGKPTRLYVPCGNLLKILIHHDDAGAIQMVSTPKSDIPDADGRRYGACMSHTYERMRFGGSVRFKYYPIRINHFKFVHCRRCYKRWSWKRFRKADV